MEETCPPARPPPRVPSELRQIALLRDLSDGELAQIFAELRVRVVQAGDMFSSEGELKQMVHFAWSGAYRLALRTERGANITVKSVRPGGHFGEITAFATGTHRPFFVLADRNGVLLEMDVERFRALVFATPALCAAVLDALARSAIMRANRIFEFATLGVRSRLLAELLRIARTGQSVGLGVIINPAPTHETIAAQIGTTREGVTRHMKALAAAGVLECKRGEIVIVHFERLRALVQSETGWPSGDASTA